MKPYEEQSEFNSAISQLHRIDALLSYALESSYEVNAHSWLHALACLVRELSAELSDKDLKYCTDKIIELNQKVSAENNRPYHQSHNKGVSTTLYTELSNFEIKLRKLLKAKGMLSKMKDDPGFALGSIS